MKICNLGSLNIDYVYKVDHFVGKGETLPGLSREVFSGGKGLNQSIALARAGLNVYHAGCIGREGDFLIETLKSESVNTDFIRVLDDASTGHAVIQNDKEGDNCILLFGGANQKVSKNHIDEVLSHFQKGDILILQNEISNNFYAIEKAHEQGLKIVLNPSPIDDSIRCIDKSYIDFLFINEVEAGSICQRDSDDIANLIEDIKCEFPECKVVLTLGKDGSVYIGDGEVIRQDVYETNTVDTTAAGDTFTGYFMYSILNGNTPKDALDIAAKASAITVSRQGAANSIPRLEEVI